MRKVERIVRVCEVCGKERFYTPGEIRQREERDKTKIRFCSVACSQKVPKVSKKPSSRKAEVVELTCAVCSKTFLRAAHQLRSQLERFPHRRHYCSKSCADIGQRIYSTRRLTDEQRIAKRREKYHNNKEQHAQKRKALWEKHEQKFREYHHNYQATHRTRINALSRQWTQKNKEKRLTTLRKYKELHKDEVTALLHLRRSRTTAGSFTGQDWQVMKQHYNHTCLCCGKREPEIALTLDHIQPITKGGIHAYENIQPLCKSCNSRKGAKTIDYRPKMEIVDVVS